MLDISNFKNKNVLIIGDIILDTFILGYTDRISPEAPVPIVRTVKERHVLGGAANVAANIKSLGANPLLVGLVGGDGAGKRIIKLMEQSEISTEGIHIGDGYRPTTVKTRIIAQNQQLIRFDKEWDNTFESTTTQSSILDNIENYLPQSDIIIISDYAKGMIAPYIKNIIQETDLMTIIDPKPSNLNIYEGCSFLTPNHHEAMKMVNSTNLSFAAHTLINKLKCDGILITKGKEGLAFYENGEKPIYSNTIEKNVFDVTGAGDTVIATFTLGLLIGMNIPDILTICNVAAGKVIQKMGTSIIEFDELVRTLKERQ